MTPRPPVSGEPSTEAGRRLQAELPYAPDRWLPAILAIEAEARATPPSLDVLHEAAVRLAGRITDGWFGNGFDPILFDELRIVLARLTSKEERP